MGTGQGWVWGVDPVSPEGGVAPACLFVIPQSPAIPDASEKGKRPGGTEIGAGGLPQGPQGLGPELWLRQDLVLWGLVKQEVRWLLQAGEEGMGWAEQDWDSAFVHLWQILPPPSLPLGEQVSLQSLGTSERRPTRRVASVSQHPTPYPSSL